MGAATSERSVTSPPLGARPRASDMNGRSNGSPSPQQPQVIGATVSAAASGEPRVALEDVGGARLLLSDARVALLLLDEARYRIVHGLFGVERDQSWPVTLIALAVLAQAAHEKSDQVFKGPGGPTRSDVALGVAALREPVAWILGPSLRDTPLVGTLVTIAVVGAVVRPVLKRAAHRMRTSSHDARLSFNHRYGHLIRLPAASNTHP